MNKEELCKVTINGVIYKAYAVVTDNRNEVCYRVMKGRNIAKGGSYFTDQRAAIMFLLRTAFADVAQLEMGGLV